MIFKKKIKPQNSKLIENLITIIVSFVIVLGGYFIFIEFFLFRQADNTNDDQVLGLNSEFVEPRISLESETSDNFRNIIISSGIQTDKYIFFDNLNRNYLEGTSIPNSEIELEIGKATFRTKTNPDGFFSFELPKDLVQFSIGEVSILDKDFQIKSGFRFVLILRNYLHRTYFFIKERDEIFSLQLPNDYKNDLDQFDKTENLYCSAIEDPNIDSGNFDIIEDNDIVIFPFSIDTLDFDQNKYCAFKISNIIDPTNYTSCKDEWKQYEKTLIWHTEQTLEIFKGETSHIPDFIPVYSNTIR